MRRFIIIIIIFAAIGSHKLRAQEHEFSAHLGGGLGSLGYQLSALVGERNGGAGVDFGLGYTFRLSNWSTGPIDWGLHTGVGVGFYNAKTTIDDNKSPVVSHGLTDADLHRFDMHTTLFGYEESQTAMYLVIPLMGQFKYDLYYFGAGFKFGLPINGKFASEYSSSSKQIFNEGYYTAQEVSLDKPKFAGYGAFTGNGMGDEKIEFGASVILALEGGVNLRLNDNLSLYIGAYFDAGLNNIAKNIQKPFVNYQVGKEDEFTTNSVLSSFDEKVKTMGAGVKVRIAFKN